MKKNILERIIRTTIAITLAIVLFPYLKDFVIEHENELTLLFLFPAIILITLMLSLFFVLHKLPFYKKLLESPFWEIIYNLLIISLHTLFVATLLTAMSPFWACIVLISVEVLQIIGEIYENLDGKEELNEA